MQGRQTDLFSHLSIFLFLLLQQEYQFAGKEMRVFVIYQRIQLQLKLLSAE